MLFAFVFTTNFFSVKLSAQDKDGIVIENTTMRLLIGSNGQALSLVHKASGQECLQQGTNATAFSITQYRPYDNELQLKYPANPKTFSADSVYRDGDHLVVGFELINIVATIGLKITDHYIGFTLEKLDYRIPGFGDKLKTSVDELVLLQLPVKNRQNFGEWLNVVWDDEVAVNLLAADPFTKIDAVKDEGYHLLRSCAVSEVKSLGTGAALIVTDKNNLLNCIDRVEQDYNLPRGVESRRKKEYNYSYYETWDINPQNVDEHIAFAKQGGFRSIQIVWTAFASSIGHFPWRPEYPNGKKDLQMIVRKINDAGMIAGAHFWYNKAMKKDLYVSPVPDYRLNLSRAFTLASPLDKESTTVFVEENPTGCTLDNERRILKIGTELIEYTGYTNERPYQFTGCTRGVLNTVSSEYGQGFRFGLLDVDTWPIWVRFDQRTSIQDEVAERIGKIYNEAGFQYVYFDGAEDIPQPYWYNTSIAQLKVYNSMKPAPAFSEGALKSHFSWHILSRGNAFDVFAPEVIKKATREHPLDEIKFVAGDFTSINFGWINYTIPGEKTIGMQPDMFEYVCSRATAWDCPVSLEGKPDMFKAHPRTVDNLEVFRRWEDARLSNFFSEKQKEEMKNGEPEHILLIDENGKFELQPYQQITDAAKSNPVLRAFVFSRLGKIYVVYWHISGEGKLKLNLDASKVCLYKQLGKKISVSRANNGVVVPLGDRHYLEIDLDRETVISAFRNAEIL
ncbi:MAG TPA: hypothetical protein DD458_09975 [Prolixibacteraceae bacterium]|nr:hypothetical protein [Prolixibacteraceae bacterium]HCR91087.1 hypothetical protein [Prolixibacteraceae bacterium]HCU62570.1 hypothetical protein [Prolixibacteraceae bacterium]